MRPIAMWMASQYQTAAHAELCPPQQCLQYGHLLPGPHHMVLSQLEADSQALRMQAQLELVGVDPFLTQTELAAKRKLKGLFDSERAKGTPKVFWRGCRLFANGQELKL